MYNALYIIHLMACHCIWISQFIHHLAIFSFNQSIMNRSVLFSYHHQFLPPSMHSYGHLTISKHCTRVKYIVYLEIKTFSAFNFLLLNEAEIECDRANMIFYFNMNEWSCRKTTDAQYVHKTNCFFYWFFFVWVSLIFDGNIEEYCRWM